MNPSRPLHGLVLAGGRSKRMGTDKAALIHPDGRPLARRAVDLLSQVCDKVVVSLRHQQPPPPQIAEGNEIHIARDPEGKSEGPLVGIIAAMRRFPDADCLVVACDLPRLDEETLRHLASSRQVGECFLAYRSEFDGLPEPLCAYYAAEALPVLEQALNNHFRCPRKILIQQSCRLLDAVNPSALDNANTPEDWNGAHSS